MLPLPGTSAASRTFPGCPSLIPHRILHSWGSGAFRAPRTLSMLHTVLCPWCPSQPQICTQEGFQVQEISLDALGFWFFSHFFKKVFFILKYLNTPLVKSLLS